MSLFRGRDDNWRGDHPRARDSESPGRLPRGRGLGRSDTTPALRLRRAAGDGQAAVHQAAAMDESEPVGLVLRPPAAHSCQSERNHQLRSVLRPSLERDPEHAGHVRHADQLAQHRAVPRRARARGATTIAMRRVPGPASSGVSPSATIGARRRRTPATSAHTRSSTRRR
jgi:hypothetical protein